MEGVRKWKFPVCWSIICTLALLSLYLLTVWQSWQSDTLIILLIDSLAKKAIMIHVDVYTSPEWYNILWHQFSMLVCVIGSLTSFLGKKSLTDPPMWLQLVWYQYFNIYFTFPTCYTHYEIRTRDCYIQPCISLPFQLLSAFTGCIPAPQDNCYYSYCTEWTHYLHWQKVAVNRSWKNCFQYAHQQEWKPMLDSGYYR